MAAQDRVIIRPYPKVVFFYPTFLVALFTMIYGNFGGDPGRLCGIFFSIVFAANLLIFSIEFTKSIFVQIITSVFMLFFMILWIDTYYHILGNLSAVLSSIDIQMNEGFYAFMTFIYALTYAVVMFDTRFEYCEITSNEIIFHAGIFSDVKRYPAPSMKYDQAITDVFEYMLLRSGMIKLRPAGEPEPIILDSVPFVKEKFNELDRILSKTEVEVVQPPPQQSAPISAKTVS